MRVGGRHPDQFLQAREAQTSGKDTSDLDAMAAGERNLDMLRGWRAEVFGDEAKRLCQGEIGLVAKGRVVTTFELPK